MTPDQLCGISADKKIKLNLWIDEDEKLVFVQGDKKSLVFLGELILSIANFENDDGFSINPNGAGQVYFNKKKSTHGIYFNRKDK